MQKNSFQILWLLMLIAFISISHFFCLLLHAPLWVTALLALLFGYFSYRWASGTVYTTQTTPDKYRYWPYLVLLTGVAIIVNKTYYIETKYGGWDAWLIWNYHAKVLQHPNQWRLLFNINKFFHADYPLLLSSTIAFFWRLIGTDTLLVPFLISFLFTLIIPVFLYLELYRKNILIAGLVLILLATDEYYLSQGVSQYADLPLAFFFLAAIVASGYINTNRHMPLIAGVMLGCCIWTKNEGIMLSAFFCLFYAKTIAQNSRWKYFLAGIGPLLITLLAFKSMAPTNDLLNNRSVPLSTYALDGVRYKLIWTSLKDNVNTNFATVKFGLILYTLLCIVERKWPGRNMFLLLACVTGYFFVYVFTNKDLEWHLHTSMDRVLLQLMPSFVYVIALRLTRLQIPLRNKSLQ